MIPPHSYSSVGQDFHGKDPDQDNSSCFFLKEAGLRSWQAWLNQAEAKVKVKVKVKVASPSLSAAGSRSSSMVETNNVVCRRY